MWKGLRVGRKILMGCGALAILGVLGIVAVGCLAIIGGGETDTTSSQDSGAPTAPEKPGQAEAEAPEPPPLPEFEPEAEPAPEEEPEGPRADMNEAVRVGDVSWTITKARQRNEIKDPFGDRKAGNFVVVDFDFTNEGSEQVTLDSESLELLDGRDRKFGVDTDNLFYVPDDRNIFLEQVNPGVTKLGRAIFTVAPDAQNFTISVGDTQMFADENGYVKLPF